MRSSLVLALAPLLLVIKLVLAQTCPCAQQTAATCEVLELSGPGTCSSSITTCDKCLCVSEGSGASTCNVESAQAVVFTGSGSECALQTVSYAKCPEVDNVGWTLATGVVDNCNDACATVGGTCNPDPIIALNDLGKVDVTAFASVFSDLGLDCRSFRDADDDGVPYLYNSRCFYSYSQTPTCEANGVPESNVRICCCGADEDCPVPTPTPTPTLTPTPTATPTPTPTIVPTPGWTLATGFIDDCNDACATVGSTCNIDRIIALNDLGGINNTALGAKFSELGVECRSFQDAIDSGVPYYYGTFCTYTTSRTPTCEANGNPNSNLRLCCCGADEDCPI